jgi:hypothetical protein
VCKRAGSTLVEVAGSHAIYVSQPKAVAKLVSAAAQSAGNKRPLKLARIVFHSDFARLSRPCGKQQAIVLEIIRQLVHRLIKLHVIRARHDHHDHATILAFLDCSARLKPKDTEAPEGE